MLLELRRIKVPPGQRVTVEAVTWQEFERIVDELEPEAGTRLAYDQGLLEIMVPLPEHEDNKEIIGDLIKALLEELNIEFRSLGSTTFKKSTTQGLEPDQCFYIQHEPAIRGKQRIDLKVDPPPDLAIEIDITVRTHVSLYEALQVPELWRFERGSLQINVLTPAGTYREVTESPNFPGLDLKQQIPRCLQESKVSGRTPVLRAFRRWVRDQMPQSP